MKNIYTDAPDLKNSIYFHCNENPTESKDDILNEISSFPGFDKVINYAETSIECDNISNFLSMKTYCYNHDMIANFKLDVSDGRWLSNDSDKVEIVIYGDELSEVPIGKTILLDNSIYATVVGRVAYNILPDFSLSSPNYNTSDFFRQSSNCGFIINSDMIDENYYTDHNSNYQYQGAFICLNNNATYNEKTDIINYLSDYGNVNDYDTVINNTDKLFETWAGMLLPLPLFLLIICTISLLSLSAIIIKRSMNEQAKYYLIGCSKTKSVSLLASSLTFVFSLPSIINIILIVFFPDFLRKDTLWDTSKSILNFWSFVPLFIYLAFIISFVIISSIAFYKKHSPLSFYRRNL